MQPIIVDCPVCETDEYRLEVLIAIRTLERLDKDVYEQDERQDAEEVRLTLRKYNNNVPRQMAAQRKPPQVEEDST